MPRWMLWMIGGWAVWARAYSYSDSYVPPELLYPSPSISIPGCVNLNKDGYPALMALPGMTQDVALKIMRLRAGRAFKKTTDLYRLPLSPREVSVLVERLGAKVCY